MSRDSMFHLQPKISARHSGRSALCGSKRKLEVIDLEIPGSRVARPDARHSSRIPFPHAVDQRVFPIRQTAKPERRRIGAAVIHVAVELPGKTHAAMDLDVVLGAMLERLR